MFNGLFSKKEIQEDVYVVYISGFSKEKEIQVKSYYSKSTDMFNNSYYFSNNGERILAIKSSDLIIDELKTEREAEAVSRICKILYPYMESVNTRLEKLEDKKSQQEAKLVVDNSAGKLKLNDPYGYGDLRWNAITGTISTFKNNNHIYVITGEYPNYLINKKEIVTNDEFNYCLRELDTNNISMWPSNKCFKSYEEANNKLLDLIQKETNKEHKCACHCVSSKKK